MVPTMGLHELGLLSSGSGPKGHGTHILKAKSMVVRITVGVHNCPKSHLNFS